MQHARMHACVCSHFACEDVESSMDNGERQISRIVLLLARNLREHDYFVENENRVKSVIRINSFVFIFFHIRFFLYIRSRDVRYRLTAV